MNHGIGDSSGSSALLEGGARERVDSRHPADGDATDRAPAIEAGQLARLLRDLDLVVPAAVKRAVAPARAFVWLRTRLIEADLRGDALFEDRLCSHFAMRGKLRARRTDFFEWLHRTRHDQRGHRFDVVLRSLSSLTGQTEKSVASQVLALLDPSRPVIDRGVRELLPRYGFVPLGEAPPFDDCLAYYRRLDALFAQVLLDPRWPAIELRFSEQLGPSEAELLPARKLYLLLSHSRRLIALLPAFQRGFSGRGDRAGERSDTAPSAGAPVQRARLHLCR